PKVPHGAYDAVVRKQVEPEPLLARALLPLLDAREVLYRTYLKLDNEVKAIVRHDRVCQQLMSVPGVGAITALTFKAAVDDPHRFRRSRTVAAHFGLIRGAISRARSITRDESPRREIPKSGAALYVAAHSLLSRSATWSSLKAWGVRLAKTRGHRRAVIAVARKLAVIMHKMWIDGTEFQWSAEPA